MVHHLHQLAGSFVQQTGMLEAVGVVAGQLGDGNLAHLMQLAVIGRFTLRATDAQSVTEGW